MKYNSVKKPTRCPVCGSEKIAEILYGLPAFSPELDKMIKDHKITLGGCCVTGDNPLWECVDCNTVIYKLEMEFNGSVN
jgi:hypothetical protein